MALRISKATDGGDIFLSCTSYIEITLQPNEIRFFDAEDQEMMAQSLPDNDNIVIQATSGFTDNNGNIYHWQYSTIYKPDVNNDDLWQDFPATVQNNRQTLTFRGPDLFTPEGFRDMVINDTKVYVRIKTPTKEPRRMVVLNPTFSAPHIQNAEVVSLETCNGDGDARVKITFDRMLLPGEKLNIAINKDIQQSAAKTIYASDLDPVDNSIIIENVKSGDNQVISVTGAYENGSESYPFYHEGASHSKVITIPARPKISHTVVGAHVNCHEGSDGQITVTATGGTGSYTATLTKIGDAAFIPRDMPLVGNTSGIFGGLIYGTYKIDVSDSNGCHSANTNVTVELTQPEAPVSVIVEPHTMIQPLAYDSHDGEVTLRVGGGTKTNDGGYITLFSHEEGQSFTPASRFPDSNGDVLYTFRNLGRGDYSVIIQDRNYNSYLGRGGQPDIPCTCEAKLNFYLPAPPPLTVEIAETHYVNWYGGDQGELTAVAEGGVPLTSGNLPYNYTWYRLSDQGVMQVYPVVPSNSDVASGLKAGTYQVQVTDKNGITKISDPYILTQPDPITVQFVTVQTGCYGASSGKITATVSGGVPDYTYQWNIEGATGNEVSSLEAGTYLLKVTDTRGGYLATAIEVKSSSTLTVDSLVTQPTCLMSGAIHLQLSGATPPYQVRWDDSQTTSLSRGDLMPGVYRVLITDANNCANSYTFSLKEPRGFTVDLGGDLVMNRNQTRMVEAVCREPNLSYEWYLDDTLLSGSGNQILVDRAGVYSVKAVNTQGCFATDRINVRFTQETLELNMTVPTTIEVGTEIHAVNISTVSADRIDWKAPEGAVIVKQSDTELVFTLNEEGTYTVSMEGFKGEGATIVTREITVVRQGEVELPDSDTPLIKQFWVSPNPSTGYFKVVVELSEPNDFTMTLYSPSGVLMDTKEVKGMQSQTFEYEINGSLQGTYLLHLKTKVDASVLQIIIKRD